MQGDQQGIMESIRKAVTAAVNNNQQHCQLEQLEEKGLTCPRCQSTNTKFCYYNNYNLSQPRYFCKGCRRYWTKGGAIRNIPVGGGRRRQAKKLSTKNRNIPSSISASPSPSSSSSSSIFMENGNSTGFYPPVAITEERMLDITGSFSSLLASNTPFGSLNGVINDPRRSESMRVMDSSWVFPGFSAGLVGNSEVLTAGRSTVNIGDHHHHHHGTTVLWGGGISSGWGEAAGMYDPGPSNSSSSSLM